MQRPPSLITGVLFLFWGWSATLAEEMPLHRQIDQLIAARQIGPMSERADDATFARRLFLDLAGRIPTHLEIQEFLADSTPDKRQKLIDRVLAGEEFPRQMAIVLDVMLMERRGGTHIPSDKFREYLETSLRQSKPFHLLASEILGADGSDERIHEAAAFFLERNVEPQVLTRDVGRMFFGIDLQCAQCHNHPLIDDYLQQDFYGLHAFFVRTSLFQPDKKNRALIAEQATGEATFKSVFTDREGVIGGRLPEGREMVEATLMPGEQYRVAPAKDVRPIPAISRLEMLSKAIAETPTPAFSRNITNRLWTYLFGRGLVHPVDLHHSGNPAVYPEVMTLLADHFAAGGYQIKPLLRELALTDAYQRSFRLPPATPDMQASRDQLATLTQQAGQFSEQAEQAAGVVDGLIDKLDEAVLQGRPLETAEQQAFKEVEAALKAVGEAGAKVRGAEQKLATGKANHQVVQDALEKTRLATEALKDDKELASALKTIEGRAMALAGVIQQTEAELAKEQAALQQMNEKLTVARTAADAAIKARAPHEEQLRGMRQELFAARKNLETLRAQATVAQRAVESLQTVIQHGELVQQQNQIAQQISTQSGELTELSKQIPEVSQQLTQYQSSAEQAQMAYTTKMREHEQIQGEKKQVEATQAQLVAAISQADAALKSLKEGDSVTQAIKLLQESSAKVDEDLVGVTSRLSESAVQLKEQENNLSLARKNVETSTQMLKTLQQRQSALQASVQTLSQEQSTVQARIAATWTEVVQNATHRFQTAGLTPLTPEQLAWSVLIATGEHNRQHVAITAKLNKEKPLSEEAAQNATQLAERNREIEALVITALKPAVKTFVNLYAAGSGQPQDEFFATAEQSLFAANGAELRNWLRPSPGNLTDRLMQQQEAGALATELYLGILSRQPSPEEIEDVTAYLASRPEEKSHCVQELAWGLLCSAEFRFRY